MDIGSDIGSDNVSVVLRAYLKEEKKLVSKSNPFRQSYLCSLSSHRLTMFFLHGRMHDIPRPFQVSFCSIYFGVSKMCHDIMSTCTATWPVAR